MLKPIPSAMLRHEATLTVPRSVDIYQEAAPVDTYALSRVCIQRESKTIKTSDNTTVETAGTLFVDARLSRPKLDYLKLKAQADVAGGDMRVLYGDRAYTVTQVQEYLDDHARLHHWELTLV